MKTRVKFSDLIRHYDADRRDAIDQYKAQLRAELGENQPTR